MKEKFYILTVATGTSWIWFKVFFSSYKIFGTSVNHRLRNTVLRESNDECSNKGVATYDNRDSEFTCSRFHEKNSYNLNWPMDSSV